MDKNGKIAIEKRIHKTIQALKKNNMEGFYAPTKEDAVAKVKALLEEGQVITCGGSMTLNECGVKDLMRSGAYHFMDREAPGLTSEELEVLYRQSFSADAYITGTNAITEDGLLYNIDGTGNRVAAILYGPKKVIVVAGYNKLVKNLEEAIARVKTVAAPVNAIRLDRKTYCTQTGECMGICGQMADGCRSEERICSLYAVCGMQAVYNKDRIKVILVGEELGY